MSTTPRGHSSALGIAEVSAGVDWITHITDTRRASDQLAEIMVALGRVERAAGAPVKPFRFMGYEGQMVGGVRLGFKGPAAVAQLSGDLCNDSWIRLASSSGRTTRLDLQTTVTLSQSQSGFARSLLRPRGTTRHKRPQHRPKISYSSDTSGLAIGTVGRRTSRAYGRVYDKGVEKKSAPPGIRWRVEIEAKHDLAGDLWQTLKRQEDARAWCYGTCESVWKSWGLSWRLPASGRLPLDLRAPERQPAPAHALAAWLRSSVAPTLPRVLTAYSVAELLELLGIDHLATTRPEGADSGDLG